MVAMVAGQMHAPCIHVLGLPCQASNRRQSEMLYISLTFGVSYGGVHMQEVLRQQQQALTESDDDMMQRILGPAQCALLIVDALPAAAVALPLAETVASMYGGGHQSDQPHT